MTENEIKTLTKLTEQLMPSGVVVSIEMQRPDLCGLTYREDLVVFDINYARASWDTSTDQFIVINGNAITVAKNWVFPVDMIVVDDEIGIFDNVKVWKDKLIDGGIFAILGYTTKKSKEIINELFMDCEQIARVDTLVAYRVRDKATMESWALMESAYQRYESYASSSD